MLIYWREPSANLLQKAIENGHRKFVDLPINSMVIFHSFLYVYQRVGDFRGFQNLGNFPEANSSDDIPVDLAEALDAF